MNTIPGGAYLSVSNQWIDSEGKPLSEEQIATAKELLAERAEANAAADEAKMEQALRNDPLAQTLARQFGKSEPKKAEKPASKPTI